jgi:hypothetical protein
MKIANRDPFRAGQLRAMLDGKPDGRGGWFIPPEAWEKVAKFAASCCQVDALNLKPWEMPPCHPGIDPLRGDGSLKLRAKMDAAGISKWHPDPMAALRDHRHV